MGRIESGKRYFTLRAGPGHLTALIPKGTPVTPDVLHWAAADFNQYVSMEGFRSEIDDLRFQEFRRTLRKYPNGFKEDYVVLKGEDPKEPEQPRLEWLADPDAGPRDLVSPNVPFLRVVAPKPPREGRDVYGHVILPKVRDTPTRIHLQPDPAITTIDEEHYVSSESGQVVIEGQRLRFHPAYTVSEIGAPWVKTMKWTCPVVVTCDLDGIHEWVVNGDLTVDGHWSSGNVTVYGNVRARSGIQTNMNGIIRVYGDVEVPFIQMTRMGITGNLLIERAALQCELRVGGELRCRGTPGALLGCTVDVFGGLHAQRAGSENGQKTTIRLHEMEEAPHEPLKLSRIAVLAAGTSVQAGKRSWTQKDDGYFNSEEG